MTTSLPLSKALYEKGLKIETEKCHPICYQFKTLSYPAYSTDELLAVLTKDTILCVIQKSPVYLEHYKKFKNFSASLVLFEFIKDVENIGKMCLWLLENGYHFNGKELVR